MGYINKLVQNRDIAGLRKEKQALINIINNYEQELVDIIDKIPARGQKLEKEINLLKAKLFAITEAIEKLEKSSF